MASEIVNELVTHTLGPWSLNDRREPATLILAPNGRPLFKVAGESLEGDARLVVKAPDMLDLLKECAELLDNYSDVNDGEDGQPRPNRAMSLGQDVEALIASIEGAR